MCEETDSFSCRVTKRGLCRCSHAGGKQEGPRGKKAEGETGSVRWTESDTDVAGVANISEAHLLLPPFFSLIVATEAASYLGTDKKHLHYECMRLIKGPAQRREVEASVARLQLAGGTASPVCPRLL